MLRAVRRIIGDTRNWLCIVNTLIKKVLIQCCWAGHHVRDEKRRDLLELPGSGGHTLILGDSGKACSET